LLGHSAVELLNGRRISKAGRPNDIVQHKRHAKKLLQTRKGRASLYKTDYYLFQAKMSEIWA
jgi:hypothetical protein